MKSAFENRVGPQSGGFAREDDEHRLGDFLGVSGDSDLTKRHRIDEVDVPLNQPGEGLPSRAGCNPSTGPCRSHLASTHLLPMAAKSDIYFFTPEASMPQTTG